MIKERARIIKEQRDCLEYDLATEAIPAQIFDSISDFEKALMAKHLGGESWRELGNELGVYRERARQITERARRKIYKRYERVTRSHFEFPEQPDYSKIPIGSQIDGTSRAIKQYHREFHERLDSIGGITDQIICLGFLNGHIRIPEGLHTPLR